MKLYQTPDDGAVIEHDGTLWQPTDSAESPNLQDWIGGLDPLGWHPSNGPLGDLSLVAERSDNDDLPTLLVSPEELGVQARRILREQGDIPVGFWALQYRELPTDAWDCLQQGLCPDDALEEWTRTLLRRGLRDMEPGGRLHRLGASQVRVMTWDGRGCLACHPLGSEVVASLLAEEVEQARRRVLEATQRMCRHAVRMVRAGVAPARVKALFVGELVAEAVDREQRALAAEAAVGEALAEIESPVTMRVERDRFGGDELRVTPDVLADWEAELTGQTAPSPAEVAEAVDRVCAAIARRGLAVRVASDPHAGEWIVVSY